MISFNQVVSPIILNNYMSVQMAASYSGYSQQYLRRLLRLGKLAGLKIGQIWLVDLKSLEIYLNHALNSKDQRFRPNLRE